MSAAFTSFHATSMALTRFLMAFGSNSLLYVSECVDFPLLLWMLPVDCPVHPHGGLQVVQPPVDADAVDDGCQSCGTEPSGARRNGVTNQTSNTGVHQIPVQVQLGQNLLCVFQSRIGSGQHTGAETTGANEGPRQSSAELHGDQNTHSSISEMNLVSKLPGVNSASEGQPLNNSFSSVSFSRTRRTISPKYMPLIIFSNLEEHRRGTE